MNGRNTKRTAGIKIPFRMWYGLAVGFIVIPVIVFCLGSLRWSVGRSRARMQEACGRED